MNLKGIKPIGLILIAVLVIGGICVFSVFGGLRNLLGGGQTASSDRAPVVGSRDEAGNLGRMYAATDIDQSGCPIDLASEFYSDETIYVGVEESEIPRGTTMFMRLNREGVPIEDTDEVQAQDDTLSCVWFQFEPTGGSGFDPGQYEAELFVNGNNVDSIRFDVADSVAGNPPLAGTGSDQYELGRLVTTSDVDGNGCPVDDVYQFYSDEPVYVSYEKSFIPAGTQISARLVRDGQALEDTQPIYAERDMESCVWFAFEGRATSGGLQPGDYEVEIYINNNFTESIDFVVR